MFLATAVQLKVHLIIHTFVYWREAINICFSLPQAAGKFRRREEFIMI